MTHRNHLSDNDDVVAATILGVLLVALALLGAIVMLLT